MRKSFNLITASDYFGIGKLTIFCTKNIGEIAPVVYCRFLRVLFYRSSNTHTPYQSTVLFAFMQPADDMDVPGGTALKL